MKDLNKANSNSKKKDYYVRLFFGIILAVIILLITFDLGFKFASDKNSIHETHVANMPYERTNLPDSSKFVHYQTGDLPFKLFYGFGKYDKETMNSLLIKNGSETDAVVFLESLSGSKIRHAYVQKGDDFKMVEIPGGKYIVKVLQGDMWKSNKNNGKYAPKGGFTKNVSMSMSMKDDPFDYPDPKSGHYYDYEITLYKVSYGNLHTEDINESEMF